VRRCASASNAASPDESAPDSQSRTLSEKPPAREFCTRWSLDDLRDSSPEQPGNFRGRSAAKICGACSRGSIQGCVKLQSIVISCFFSEGSNATRRPSRHSGAGVSLVQMTLNPGEPRRHGPVTNHTARTRRLERGDCLRDIEQPRGQTSRPDLRGRRNSR